MIKFEFTLSDIDAQNLMDILDMRKEQTLIEADRFYPSAIAGSKSDMMNYQWCKGHAEYLEGLKQKVAEGSSRISKCQ